MAKEILTLSIPGAEKSKYSKKFYSQEFLGIAIFIALSGVLTTGLYYSLDAIGINVINLVQMFSPTLVWLVYPFLPIPCMIISYFVSKLIIQVIFQDVLDEHEKNRNDLAIEISKKLSENDYTTSLFITDTIDENKTVWFYKDKEQYRARIKKIQNNLVLIEIFR